MKKNVIINIICVARDRKNVKYILEKKKLNSYAKIYKYKRNS